MWMSLNYFAHLTKDLDYPKTVKTDETKKENVFGAVCVCLVNSINVFCLGNLIGLVYFGNVTNTQQNRRRNLEEGKYLLLCCICVYEAAAV